MAITCIYHHAERSLTDPYVRALKDDGHDVRMAPLGLEVGSPEWQERVQADIQQSSDVLLFVTRRSLCDPWVAWRADRALEQKCAYIPIVCDELDARVAYADELPGMVVPKKILQCNWLHGDRHVDLVVDVLAGRKPKLCFISYSRVDLAFAERLAADLEGHQIAAWRDQQSIPAGAAWDAAIVEGIRRATHVLAIITPAAVRSANVADELSFARDRGKRIIPLILQEAELPMRIHRAQAIDFRTDYESALARLLTEVRSAR
jgi:hypothetical protein